MRHLSNSCHASTHASVTASSLNPGDQEMTNDDGSIEHRVEVLSNGTSAASADNLSSINGSSTPSIKCSTNTWSKTWNKDVIDCLPATLFSDQTAASVTANADQSAEVTA